MGCCNSSKYSKYIWIVIALIILAVVVISFTSCAGDKKPRVLSGENETVDEKEIDFYTCGMHPSVKVSPEEYKNGQVNCPICNMKLIPVYKKQAVDEKDYYGCGMEGAEHVFLIEGIKDMDCPICGMPLKRLSKQEADKLKGIVGRVEIKDEQAALAGVNTRAAAKRHLIKEIRTVGRVAYDPELAIAQEEFISALKASEKIEKGNIPEIKERAKNLVESSKRKLRLLGLSQGQIKQLQKSGKIHTNLILPEEKMWIYGDIYEYELSWIKIGGKVKVTTPNLPGEEFEGIIASINPVLNPKTRSVTFRAEIDNPELRLKPEMYVDVVIMNMYTSPEGEHMVLAIPKDAVLDTGRRKIVWVDKGNGLYEGREVKVGPEATSVVDGIKFKFYPVLSGLSEGDLVVFKANFLIDSQSQITGVASVVYGGAIGKEDQQSQPVHRH